MQGDFPWSHIWAKHADCSVCVGVAGCSLKLLQQSADIPCTCRAAGLVTSSLQHPISLGPGRRESDIGSPGPGSSTGDITEEYIHCVHHLRYITQVRNKQHGGQLIYFVFTQPWQRVLVNWRRRTEEKSGWRASLRIKMYASAVMYWFGVKG